MTFKVSLLTFLSQIFEYILMSTWFFLNNRKYEINLKNVTKLSVNISMVKNGNRFSKCKLYECFLYAQLNFVLVEYEINYNCNISIDEKNTAAKQFFLFLSNKNLHFLLDYF